MHTYSCALIRKGLLVALLSTGILAGIVPEGLSSDARSSGATVYVPVYSHIYVGIKGITFDLAISLSIRNTDPHAAITVQSVAYYDSDGKFVKGFIDRPVHIGPLASKDFFVSEADTTGGFGASFIVKWTSAERVNEPIVEGVMAGTKSGQGISFTSRGQVIGDRPQ